jgi:hypothetical protein
MKRDDSMENAEVLRRIITILDRYTTRVEDNVRYGDYPFISQYNGHIRLFIFDDVEQTRRSLTGWLLPVGIPFLMSYIGRRPTSEESVNRARVIAYYLGNALYVHETMFNEFIDSKEKKVLFNSEQENYVSVVPGGWNTEEQHGFSKYLWQFVVKSMSGDFREVMNINFESILHVNTDILFRDGWVVSKIAGRNVFYGIVDCPVEQYNVTVDVGEKYIWYNKYLTILDITGGNGIQTFGRVAYGECYHPHVSGEGNLCRGNATRMIQDKLNNGLLTEFFIFMKDFLSHYYHENPFFKLPISQNNTNKTMKGPTFIRDKIYRHQV